jgi:hypothetical protein
VGCEPDPHSLDIIQANGDDKYQNNIKIIHLLFNLLGCTTMFFVEQAALATVVWPASYSPKVCAQAVLLSPHDQTWF